MPFASDIVLGPFTVDRDGRLSPRDPERLRGFSARWRGCAVHARLVEGKIALRATLGRVPSSLGAARTLREPLFAVLRDLPAELPRSWRLRLNPDHTVALDSEEAFDLPASAVDLVVVISRFLLALAPYLDLLASTGVAGLPPEEGSALGMAKA